MPGQPHVHYALLTALLILFRTDPASAQAALTAATLWEVLNRTKPAH